MTSAFTHVEVLYIAFNMFALYVLGPQLEMVIGRARFLALYPDLGARGLDAGLLGRLPSTAPPSARRGDLLRPDGRAARGGAEDARQSPGHPDLDRHQLPADGQRQRHLPAGTHSAVSSVARPSRRCLVYAPAAPGVPPSRSSAWWRSRSSRWWRSPCAPPPHLILTPTRGTGDVGPRPSHAWWQPRRLGPLARAAGADSRAAGSGSLAGHPSVLVPGRWNRTRGELPR